MPGTPAPLALNRRDGHPDTAQKPRRRRSVMAAAAALTAAGCILCVAVPPAFAAPRQADGNKARATAAVQRYFAGVPDHRPGDIISRDQAREVLSALRTAGYPVPDEKEILSDVLEEGHFVVTQLRTRSGRRFMRKVSGYPLAYDRLDRLSSMRGGKNLIRTMVQLPDGADLMRPKPTPGLNNLAQLLPKGASGKTPSGRNFHRPTGNIYTVDQLIERIAASYHAAARGA